MSLPLTNLDDRRWADLVEEGRALIPFYSPAWTDHNFSDPGITLIELFAWLAEMDIYRLNRISESHVRKFLALIDINPTPPAPALGALSLVAKNGQAASFIPASAQFEGVDDFGSITRFRSINDVYVVASQLTTVQFKDGTGIHDLTGQFSRGEEMQPFGPDPRIGYEFYLGFSAPLPPNTQLSLLFIGQDFDAGEAARRKLLEERGAAAKTCLESLSCECRSHHSDPQRARKDDERSPLLAHHSVRLAWEFSAGRNRWQQLNGGSEIVDDTRSLTLNGRVLLKLPTEMTATTVGKVQQPLCYLRARIVRGAYDSPPRLRRCAINGLLAEQATPVGVVSWDISANGSITGDPPRAGRRHQVSMRFNDRNEITDLTFGDSENSVALTVIDYRPNTAGHPGLLRVEGVRLGVGDGLPNLSFDLPEAPALVSDLAIFTIEDGEVAQWSYRNDFAASGRGDADFTIDFMRGLITFGDGENGRVVPKDVPVFVRYDSTRASEGNLPANKITKLADTPHNRALLGDSFEQIRSNLDRITNPLNAAGGDDAETLAHAIGRAIESINQSDRAVTLADYEALAKSTPGTQIARVTARANIHPSFPCLAAQGIVTVIALPYLPIDRPSPSNGLRRAIEEHLFPRRIVGSRFEVVAPEYKEVTVTAQVKSLPKANRSELARRIVASLNRFFDPLTGGPEGTGWPFGRDVFRSEVMQVIDDTEGVDYVQKLELATKCGEPQCGNLCLAANELVAAGQHDIEIV